MKDALDLEYRLLLEVFYKYQNISKRQLSNDLDFYINLQHREDLIEDLIKTILIENQANHSNHNTKTTNSKLNTYFSNFIQNGEFTEIKKGTAITKIFLEFIYHHQDWDKYINNHSSLPQDFIDNIKKIISMNSAEGKISKINNTKQTLQKTVKRNADITPDYLIKDEELLDLEFGKSHYEVHTFCITDSLFWPSKYLPENIEEIKKNNKYFNYILTSMENHHFENLKNLLEDNPDLKDRIQIRSIFDLEKFAELRKSGTLFPLLSDIVIYKTKKTPASNLSFTLGIIGTTVLINENTEMKNYSIKINEIKAKLTYKWRTEVS